ncbi:hypothetical protein FHL15_004251 [Xylaria flabelliformis]|uniref:Uncharacterized protein n=1 Tax=Xylaria flabelliformis TaxID=2512241 RepID=A0A553I3L7_9PEZI|nr:hypothetical protein FHL15_004251 [Xylaria flabelliformis]
MEQHIIFLLRILLATHISLVGVLAAPGRDYIAKSENGIIRSDNFKDSAFSSSHRAMSVTRAVTAQLAMVAVTVTTIETTIVNTVAVPGVLDGRITITCVSGTATDMAPLAINSAVPLQHAGSTSSLLQIINTDSAMTTSATTMAIGLGSSPTPTFDDAICDDIFCNTDGNRICIYWGGMTSWDISLGPIPGEQPTIIGTC